MRAKEKTKAKKIHTYLRMLSLFLFIFLLAGVFSGCRIQGPNLAAPETAPISAGPESPDATQTEEPQPEPEVSQQTALEEAQQKAEEEEKQKALEEAQKKAVREATVLRTQYDYEAALDILTAPDIGGGIVDEEIAAVLAEMDSLVPFEGDIPHIFFHSLIVYPEMIFTDKTTPMGGYNAGFSEKAELLKILPQLYDRGYVLYDLNACWDMVDGKMIRKEILLPPGKTPLILSVDDVAYAYGKGYAQALTVKEDGTLVYLVRNPDGETEEMPDGDVMGVVDLFVAEHPDFSYRGHKGTIALTGYQGAFGYSYETDEGAAEIQKVVAALKSDGWNFASHSYTHNRKDYYGAGCSPSNIAYDINKWVATAVPCLGETRLFVAPFGYRVKQPALQHILDAGFNIYCTVGSSVYNELNDDYALMSRIEIGGYSMTYFKDELNALFFNVDEVFDKQGRPPVIG